VTGFAKGVIGFHAAFSIWPKLCRYAESTRPWWHLTPRLDPETHLLQPGSDFQAEAAFARVDQDGNGRAGAEKLRNLGEGRLDGL
jgi:hypothetical protein